MAIKKGRKTRKNKSMLGGTTEDGYYTFGDIININPGTPFIRKVNNCPKEYTNCYDKCVIIKFEKKDGKHYLTYAKASNPEDLRYARIAQSPGTKKIEGFPLETEFGEHDVYNFLSFFMQEDTGVISTSQRRPEGEANEGEEYYNIMNPDGTLNANEVFIRELENCPEGANNCDDECEMINVEKRPREEGKYNLTYTKTSDTQRGERYAVLQEVKYFLATPSNNDFVEFKDHSKFKMKSVKADIRDAEESNFEPVGQHYSPEIQKKNKDSDDPGGPPTVDQYYSPEIQEKNKDSDGPGGSPTVGECKFIRFKINTIPSVNRLFNTLEYLLCYRTKCDKCSILPDGKNTYRRYYKGDGQIIYKHYEDLRLSGDYTRKGDYIRGDIGKILYQIIKENEKEKIKIIPEEESNPSLSTYISTFLNKRDLVLNKIWSVTINKNLKEGWFQIGSESRDLAKRKIYNIKELTSDDLMQFFENEDEKKIFYNCVCNGNQWNVKGCNGEVRRTYSTVPQQYPPGTQKKNEEFKSPEGRGGGKGEPGVPPTVPGGKRNTRLKKSKKRIRKSRKTKNS